MKSKEHDEYVATAERELAKLPSEPPATTPSANGGGLPCARTHGLSTAMAPATSARR